MNDHISNHQFLLVSFSLIKEKNNIKCIIFQRNLCQNVHNMTQLSCVASEIGDIHLLQYAYKHDIALQNTNNFYCKWLTARYGYLDCLKFLFKNDYDRQYNDKYFLMCPILIGGHLECLKFIVDPPNSLCSSVDPPNSSDKLVSKNELQQIFKIFNSIDEFIISVSNENCLRYIRDICDDSKCDCEKYDHSIDHIRKNHSDISFYNIYFHYILNGYGDYTVRRNFNHPVLELLWMVDKIAKHLI